MTRGWTVCTAAAGVVSDAVGVVSDAVGVVSDAATMFGRAPVTLKCHTRSIATTVTATPDGGSDMKVYIRAH